MSNSGQISRNNILYERSTANEEWNYCIQEDEVDSDTELLSTPKIEIEENQLSSSAIDCNLANEEAISSSTNKKSRKLGTIYKYLEPLGGSTMVQKCNYNIQECEVNLVGDRPALTPKNQTGENQPAASYTATGQNLAEVLIQAFLSSADKRSTDTDTTQPQVYIIKDSLLIPKIEIVQNQLSTTNGVVSSSIDKRSKKMDTPETPARSKSNYESLDLGSGKRSTTEQRYNDSILKYERDPLLIPKTEAAEKQPRASFSATSQNLAEILIEAVSSPTGKRSKEVGVIQTQASTNLKSVGVGGYENFAANDTTKKNQNHNSNVNRNLQGKYQCTICDDVCTDILEFRQHLQFHKELLTVKKSLPKADLSKALREYRNIPKIPIRRCRKPPLYECGNCKKKFLTFPGLQVHMTDAHYFAKFFCRKCGKGCGTAITLKRHMDWHRGLFTCFQCVASFKERLELEAHMVIHNVKCDQCDKTCKTKNQLRRHALHVHQAATYTCKPCNKTFSKHSLFTDHNDQFHYDQFHGVDEYKCKICQKMFDNLAYYEEHVYAHEQKNHKKRDHLKKQYTCNVCRKEFYDSKSSIDCQKRHGIPEYKCDMCDKAYFYRSELLIHKKIHAGEKTHFFVEDDHEVKQ